MLSNDMSDIEVSEQVPVAILMGQPDAGINKFPYLKGQIRLELERSASVLGVILSSALLMHRFNPEYYLPESAQVFYKNRRVVEVRMNGVYRSNPARQKGTGLRRWATPTPPKFNLNGDGTIVLAPEDQGRPNITVHRHDSSLSFSWDLAANACQEIRSEAELFSFDIQLTDLQVKEGEDISDAASRWPNLSEAKRLLSQVPLTQIKNILRPILPAEAELDRGLPLESKAWAFEFTANETYLRYLLSWYFAGQIDLSEFEIGVKNFAEQNSLSLGEAKVFQLVNLLARRDRFSSEGVPLFKERMRLILSEMRQPFMTLACHMTAHEWGAPREDIEVDIGPVKEDIENAVDRMLRKLMKTRDTGRPQGSMTVRTEEEIARNILGLQRKIFGAMEDVYQEASKETDRFAAEDAITRKVVSSQLDIDRSTLHNWTKLIGKGFDELKDGFLSKINSRHQ